MRISFVYSTNRTETVVVRSQEGERKRLTIMCPWGEAPVRTLINIHHELTLEERVELVAALGMTEQ